MTDVYLPGGIKEDGDAAAIEMDANGAVYARLTPEYELELIAKIVAAIRFDVLEQAVKKAEDECLR